jgi:dUTPase
MLEVLNEKCQLTRGTKYSGAIDLRASSDIDIERGETVLIPLGVKIDLKKLSDILPEDYSKTTEDVLEDFMASHFLQLMLRSGLSKDLIIANGIGLIDLDYPGEIMIRVHRPLRSVESNLYGNQTLKIKEGDRVAQISVMEHKTNLFNINSDTKREDGFGSTGTK